MWRSRIDTMIDVLEVARAEVTKTSIVHKTNIDSKLADKYLEIMQKYGMMKKKEPDKYIITEKGRLFLEKAHIVISG